MAFSVIHKSEVNNISNQMELEGAKRTVAFIESKNISIDSATVDKHRQVCKFLREKDITYHYDVWHILHNVKKHVRTAVKEFKDINDKNQLKELARRFMVHVYASVEASPTPAVCKEMVFSFFLHVKDTHVWEAKKFCQLIPIDQNINAGKKFLKESSFLHFLECRHETENFEGHHQVVDPNSKPYKKMLEIASKNQFIEDLSRLKHGNFTSFVESFHNVCIRYRPKRLFFSKKGFENRTMLSAIAYNQMREAEMLGQRPIREVYQCYSKATGEKRWKYKKSPIVEKWKSDIVEKAILKSKILAQVILRSPYLMTNYMMATTC